MKILSDMGGNNRASEASSHLSGTTDFMNMQKVQATESLTDRLLHAAEYERGITDHLIRGLVERLPKPDSIWSLDDRVKWLRTATAIFDLVYEAGDDERREISVAFKQGPTDAT